MHRPLLTLHDCGGGHGVKLAVPLPSHKGVMTADACSTVTDQFSSSLFSSKRYITTPEPAGMLHLKW